MPDKNRSRKVKTSSVNFIVPNFARWRFRSFVLLTFAFYAPQRKKL